MHINCIHCTRIADCPLYKYVYEVFAILQHVHTLLLILLLNLKKIRIMFRDQIDSRKTQNMSQKL